MATGGGVGRAIGGGGIAGAGCGAGAGGGTDAIIGMGFSDSQPANSTAAERPANFAKVVSLDIAISLHTRKALVSRDGALSYGGAPRLTLPFQLKQRVP
jgi:hypothetical protein